ncbi:MAG: sel1 repeat family protein [Pseudomonadaceae bacterium]|nr:sel1 repeat family protein [Pseudomonadaceae bacterium]
MNKLNQRLTHWSVILVTMTLLAGCESPPSSTSTTTTRDVTIEMAMWDDGKTRITVSHANREPATPEELNEAAKNGDVLAHQLLGTLYWQGSSMTMNGIDPLPKDLNAALWYYRRAAEMGDPVSAYYMGHALEFGKGVEIDTVAARQWYEMAAQKGNVLAHGQLGYFYVMSEGGLDKDDRKAVQHFRIAAEGGDNTAQFNLGVMLSNGDGVEKNLEQAARWYWASADQGNTGAMVQLALLLKDGNGIPQDIAAARSWLQMAANEGDDSAQGHLDALST